MSTWVQLATYEDPTLARMTLDFLEQAGIPVELRGDSPFGATTAQLTGARPDIRILVPEDRLEAAREAIAALTEPATGGAPFRGSGLPPEVVDEDDADDEAPARKKFGLFASCLAFVLPIGSGHYYAHHNATGVVITAGTAVMLALLFTSRKLETAAALTVAYATLVALDAFFGFFAVRRYTAQRIPAVGLQRLHGLAMLAAAAALGAATPKLRELAAEPDGPAVRAALLEHCNKDNGEACLALSRMLQKTGSLEDARAARGLATRACDLGEMSACGDGQRQKQQR